MQNKNISRIASNLKAALLILMVVMVGLQTLGTAAYARTQTAPARKGELASATEAKRILAKLGAENFSKAKDPKVRLESRKALGIFKAMAANTTKAREATLIAQLNRSIANLKALPQPRGITPQACDSVYERCIELCKEGAGNCDLCGIAQNGCYLNELAAAIGKDY